MPDFSFLRGNDFQLPPIDVYGPYKQALTLRQLADAREYQRAQTERARLQAMQERQEMAEMESFRREYKPGMAPDEVMRRWPTYGPKALTAQGQALTQQRLAETQKRLEEEAKARLEKAAAEKQEKIRQQAANIGMQAAGLPNQPQGEGPDFEKLSPREQFFNTQVASALIDQGIVPAEQFGGFQMPQDMAAAKRAYGAAYGPKEVQAYETGEQTRTNAALDTTKKKIELAGHYLGTVTDQTSYDRWRQLLPEELQPVLAPEFRGLETISLARNAMLTAQQQVQEQRAGAQATAQERTGNLTAASKARDDYAKESKNYVSVRDSWGSMQNAAAANSGAGDLALTYSFFTMQDPGSHVTSSEQVTASQLATLPQQMRIQFERLWNGQTSRLPDSIRKEILDVGRGKFEQMQEQQNKTDNYWREYAIRNKLDARDIMMDYSPAGAGTGERQQQSGGAPAAGVAPGGTPSPLLNTKPPEKPPAGKPFGVAAPDGKTYWFATKVDADGFKKRAGIR